MARTAARSRTPRQAPAPVHHPTWRPAAASFRNLFVFWSALAMASIASTEAAGTAPHLGLVLVAAAAGALVLSPTLGRRRVDRALRDVITPRLGNWPPSPSERARLARRGWANAVKAAALAALIGMVASGVELLGAGVAAAGVAGAINTGLLWFVVDRYERSRRVVVMTAGRTAGDGRRPALTFGVVPQPG